MDRTNPPPFKKTLDFNLPSSEKILSHGDKEVWYIPSPIGETVKIEFIFKSGKYYEPAPGVAHFTTQMIDKGMLSKTANQIAALLDYYGAHLELKTGFDFSSIALYTLRKYVNKLLPLVFSLIKESIFPKKELSVLLDIYSENLKINLSKNDFIASNSIRKKIFGLHPYGVSIVQEDIKKVDTDILNHFFKNYFNLYKVFIVGQMEKTDLAFIQNNIDFNKEVKEGPRHSLAAISPSEEVIDGLNKIQSSIRLSKINISRQHPDWPGAILLNHILGGYFGSRLMTNIREEKGLTYSIYSSLQNFQHATSLTIAAEVNSEKTEIALSEIRKEIKRLSDINLTELEMAKNHLIASFQNDITTVFAGGEKIKSLILAGLHPDFYANTIKKIDELQLDNLKSVPGNHYKIEDFSAIVVK